MASSSEPFDVQDAQARLSSLESQYDEAERMRAKIESWDMTSFTMQEFAKSAAELGRDPVELAEYEKSVLLEQWSTHRDEIERMMDAVAEELNEHGYSTIMYVQRSIARATRSAAYAEADAMLDAQRRQHAAAPADGFRTDLAAEEHAKWYDDSDVHAVVDVLEASAPGDAVQPGTSDAADCVRYFDDTLETLRRTEVSGAMRVKDFRISASVVDVLKPHQVEAAEHCLQCYPGGSAIWHSMGLGKSATLLTVVDAICAVRQDGFRTLLVTPVSVLGAWEAEAARWAEKLPHVDFHPPLLRGGDAAVAALSRWAARGGVLTMGFPLFVRLAEKLAPGVDLLAIDEAHQMKNSDTQLWKAVESVRAPTVVALTGSPMQNNVVEYFNIVRLVAPGLLGDPEHFRRHFVEPIAKGQTRDADDASKQRMARSAHILKSLVDPIAHRRTSEILKLSLPPKQETLIMFDGGSGVIDAKLNPLKLWQNMLDESAVVRRELILTLLHAFSQEGEPCLVFSQRLEMLESLQTMVGGLMLTGNTPVGERPKVVSRFQAGDANVFYLSTFAGSLGITLTRATRVIIADATWNPSWDAQALHRAYRYGQKSPLFVYRLVCDASIEVRIHRCQVTKLALASRINDDRDIDRVFTTEELTRRGAQSEDAPGEAVTPEEVARQPPLRALASTGLVRAMRRFDSLLQEINPELGPRDRFHAENHYLRITHYDRASVARHDSDGVPHQLPLHATHFDAGVCARGLVPASPPCITSIKKQTVVFMAHPHATIDVEYREVNKGDTPWKSCALALAGEKQTAILESTTSWWYIFSLPVEALASVRSAYRLRVRAAGEDTLPWSMPSATICCGS